MEPLPTRLSPESGRAHLLAQVGVWTLLLMAAPGCTPIDKCKSCKSSPPPAPAPACQVVTTWSNKVQFAPDPTKNGAPAPGIYGRMYLFGQEAKETLVGDGGISVELYDDGGPQPNPVPIEIWNIDKDNLKRLLRRDTFGWGYTLLLPWGTYRPDLAKVHMSVRYTPDKGTPVYAPSSTMVVEHVPPPAGSGLATVGATMPPQPGPGLPMPQLPPQPPAHTLPMPRPLL